MKQSFLKKSLGLLLASALILPLGLLRAEEASSSDESSTTVESVEKSTESASELESSSEVESETGSESASEEATSVSEETGDYHLTADQLLAQQTMLAVDWWQNSAEMRGLFIQGYALARIRLDEALAKKGDKPLAIALDLDETVLDNGPYQATNIREGKAFDPKTWDEWCALKVAKAVPGAKDFLTYADEKGVQIYYISDRGVNVLNDTIENLKSEGIPVQGEDHVMLKDPEDKTGKTARRQKVAEENDLIMLFGDNINDFEDFSKKDLGERLSKFEELQAEFGNKFIIFPNPMYGGFESALYGPEKLDTVGKLEARDKALKPIEK